MNFRNQIDEFLFGNLSEEESKKFQNQLLNDTDLVEEVKKRELVLAGMEALAHQKMRNQIQTARQEMLVKGNVDIPKSTPRRKINTWWLIAATAMIGICVAGYLFLQTDATSETLFAKNFVAYNAEFGVRNDSDEKELLQAENLYKEKKYETAIPILKKLQNEQPTNSEFDLALGNAYLSLGKTAEAMMHFDSIIKRNDSLYSDTSRWYLALSYLKLENYDESKKLLQLLANDTNADFHKEAKQLLSEM